MRIIKKAQQVRTLIRKDFDEVFSARGGSASGGKKVDALITPTSPFPAFGVGEKATDPLALYLCDVMEIPASVSGMPALSIPAGKTKSGLPVGAQIIGARMKEDVIMNLGRYLSES
jgi:aspartyl-tRNA(Asn)/glutamyl-tRNA(Gln) amidotransferase subunit A